MASQVLCYVQRKLITDWKRLVLKQDPPVFIYGSNDDGVFSNRLTKDSILWIVSSIPGRNPELVARLELDGVWKTNDPELGICNDLLKHFQKFRWIAKGTEKSRFFGHNDAGPALIQTVFEYKSGSTWTLNNQATRWISKYGSRFQRPALIHIPSEEEQYGKLKDNNPLEKHSNSSLKCVFISWKWMDNIRTVPLSLAYALAKKGIMVWLDLLALPKAQASEKINKDKPILERLLKYGYEQCICILAIDSQNYGTRSQNRDSNWTLQEWNGKLSSGRRPLRIWYHPDKMARHCSIYAASDKSLKSTKPMEAAKELIELLED